jgi:hypothetical protein
LLYGAESSSLFYFYAILQPVVHYIFTSIVIGKARKFFLSIEKSKRHEEPFFMFVLFFFFFFSYAACAEVNESEYMLLRDLLKHSYGPKEEDEKQKKKKLQKIAHRLGARKGERNMLIFAVIRMFCFGIMLAILP